MRLSVCQSVREIWFANINGVLGKFSDLALGARCLAVGYNLGGIGLAGVWERSRGFGWRIFFPGGCNIGGP